MKLSQEKADIDCAFPRNTFKSIESNRLLPNEDQKRRIHQHMGIQLKINTV
jgi:ribosome-binding protein aMBF1 (putative translation factor)